MSDEEKCILTFESVHQALRAEKVLLEAGFSVIVLPVPREISSDCGIAIKFSCEEEMRVKTVLEEQKVRIEGIHQLGGGRHEGD